MGQKRLTSGVLGILVVLVVHSLASNIFGYGSWLIHTKQTREADAAARLKKLSASDLEDRLRQANAVPRDSRLRCEPAVTDWDYVCNYLPTPKQSSTRLQFGIAVDANRWLDVSRHVPVETDVPPPNRKPVRRH